MIMLELSPAQFIECMGTDGDAYSIEALEAMCDYYEEFSDSMGEPFKFDRVAIRSEWAEYDSLREAIRDRGGEYTTDEEAAAYFEDRTTIIKIDGTDRVLIQEF